MSRLTSGNHGGLPAVSVVVRTMGAITQRAARRGSAAAGIAWAGCRGAARWLALAVLAVAAAGFAGGFAASPALADSAVTVTTTSDENVVDGACSLREAILYAENLNGPSTDCGTKATGTTTINVPAGHYAFRESSTLNNASTHLEIGPGGPGPIVIAGAGTAGTIIDDQGNAPRLLLVRAGAVVTVKNLTLQGGLELYDGGGIYNQGALTLDHVTVTANKTGGYQSGGAGRGGGIFNTGTLTLLNSIISGNSTDSGLSDIYHDALGNGNPGGPGADGGGLYNDGGSVTVINTNFTGNATGAGGDGAAGSDCPKCTAGARGGSGGHGGGGGAIFNNAGFVTLRGSVISGNTTGPGGRGGPGGFGQNDGGWGGEGGGGGAGGGIFTNAMLTVVNTTITGNGTGNGTAGGTGGQASTAAGAGVNGATGGRGPGGGIYQENGQSTVQESTIALNLRGLGATEGPNAGPAASGIEVVAGELTEIDTIVSKNDCYAFPGGQIRDGLTAGDGHLNLTFPTASCPGILADPRLGPLQDNGGPTPTMAIAPPSPAINRIPATVAAGCATTDQRGVIRPQPAGGRCDVGAYEFKP